MKKLWFSFIVICSMFLLGSLSVNAEETSSTEEIESDEILPDPSAPIISDQNANYLVPDLINMNEDEQEYQSIDISSGLSPHIIVIKWWKIESKTSGGLSNGGWRKGPSGKGKATLTATNSNTTSRSVTSTISGDYPIGKGKIGASLGVTIGESKTYGVSYSRVIPQGKREQIIYRPVYKVTKVKQRLYVAGTKSSTTKTATVKTFSHWDYSYKTI